MRVQAWAAKAAATSPEPYPFDLPDPAADAVQIEVMYCGLCHSDVSMIDNEWGMSTYPLIAGHEIVGKVSRLGAQVTHLQVGQTVGVGWTSASCITCDACVSGDQNLCGRSQPTIVGRPGGFASHVNAQGVWTLPIADDMRPAAAGPLLCGGVTVFNPFVQFAVKPTDRVGIVGVGGLGHMALQIANKWGCEVTAFTSTPDKKADLLRLGAHHVVSSRDSAAWRSLASQFDFILVTANASLDWSAMAKTLRPRGRIDFVGIVPDPIAVHVFDLLGAQRQLSASPSGSPGVLRSMLDFCGRHKIEPVVETYKMSNIDAALTHLRAGKVRYRIVLESDFA